MLRRLLPFGLFVILCSLQRADARMIVDVLDIQMKFPVVALLVLRLQGIGQVVDAVQNCLDCHIEHCSSW